MVSGTDLEVGKVYRLVKTDPTSLSGTWLACVLEVVGQKEETGLLIVLDHSVPAPSHRNLLWQRFEGDQFEELSPEETSLYKLS